jgi:putative heme-binding domain-containing protein
MKLTLSAGMAVLQWGIAASALLLPHFLAIAADVLIDVDYNQWKRALGTNVATPAETIQAPSGFKVELVRSAQPGEGSWVALAFDPQGRIVIAREDRGLLRLTLPVLPSSKTHLEIINTNLLECRGLLFAHEALYANANNSKGLYRLRDSDGDDRFDEVMLLKATPGNVGHGRNQLTLGPDGMIYIIHGDDVGFPAEGISTNSPLRHFAEDHLVPCEWDKVSFNHYGRMPYGHVVRTDRDGQTWEIVAGGLRNPFGIAFNPAGDLFTYDADMEWDAGLSWYHPTRVLHLVSGGDYGWRRGTGVLPVWSPDTLPSAVDIGVGSPTAIQFGTRSRFPEPWRSALFILEWAYGKIHAVHLQRSGASYGGSSEVFLSGRPLNVTGIDFGPEGAMYFVTGGRRTQSAIYRVTWTGGTNSLATSNRPSKVPNVEPVSRYEDHLLRLRTAPLSEIWSALDSRDHWTRYAARLALEDRPWAQWRERARREIRPDAALTALLAWARIGDSSTQSELVSRLSGGAPGLSADQKLIALRAVAVSLARMGAPSSEAAGHIMAGWEPSYPGVDSRVNQALCELLVFLQSTNVVRKTMPLIASATTQNEKFHYLFLLRNVKAGWSLEDRRAYFEWLGRASREFHGANTLPIALKFIREEATATLAPAEHDPLLETLATFGQSLEAAPSVVRPFVKDWTMAELSDLSAGNQRGTNAEDGRRLFAVAGCVQCHRVGQEGGLIGPDLTAVGSRFDRRALLESIIEPSKVVAELYRTTAVILKTGDVFEGQAVKESERFLTLAIRSSRPNDREQVITKTEIESRRLSELSSMPPGLLNTLTRDEILRLLHWLETGGK